MELVKYSLADKEKTMAATMNFSKLKVCLFIKVFPASNVIFRNKLAFQSLNHIPVCNLDLKPIVLTHD